MTHVLRRGVLPLLLLAAFAASACENASPAAPSSTAPATAATRVLALGGTLAFGAVEVGKTSDATLTISNSGTAALSVSGITVPDGYSLNWTAGTIAPGGSQEVRIRFSPTATRNYDGNLSVAGDHTAGTNTLPVSGIGTAAALAAIAGTVGELGAGPLSGVNIEVRDGPDARRMTTTDTDGRYTLDGLQPGIVTVRAWKTGYSDTDQRVSLTLGSVSTLTFSVRRASSSSEAPSSSTPSTPSTPSSPAGPSTPSTPTPTTPSPTPTPSPPPAPPSSPTTAAALDDQIFQLINDYRRSIGKAPFERNQVVWQQANNHSQEMASGAVPFGHDGFAARVAAIKASLGSGGFGAENVAMGYTSASALVNAWLGSGSHRANIEGTSTRTGISSVQSSTGVWYFTQMFY